MSTIYHNPRCSTSRAALKLLQDRGHDPQVIEYLKNPPTRQELTGLIERSGLTVREVMRTKEDAYKELDLDDQQLPDERLVDAMLSHPVLINRPIVVTGKGVRLARPLAALEDIL